jgi:hypothetical protein
LWLKAVEILTETGMSRFVGWEVSTLVQVFGSIEILMSESGLSQALELCCGPNAVLHMFSGKANFKGTAMPLFDRCSCRHNFGSAFDNRNLLILFA